MPSRALLFTDIVDSTRLTERLGDASAAEVWSAHDRRARELIAHHQGREIDRTDGFFLLFDNATDAAGFAIAYHDAIADLGCAARVGLHVGTVTLRENAKDDVARGAKPLEVEGLAKPLAARVMALARGGQTLVTATAVAALAGRVPGQARIECHGHYRVKGVEEPLEIFELGALDRATFAPPPDSDKAYRVVATGDLWTPAREVRHNLPVERDTFVGRVAELRALAHRFDDGARLVSVLGPGGMGKTRLVRRYAWSWLGDWPGGVYFCDLSEVDSLEGIHRAVASALGVALGRGDAGAQLGNALDSRGRCLVILDNFEQVVEHAAATVGLWLERAGQASFVVTSRERLHLAGEEIVPLEPLPLHRDAINLFATRADAQRPGFALDEGNRAAIAEVVRLLDGMPLAIELAAARARVLTPVQLVERMRDRFALLATPRGADARQATLRAAIDWSWELLTSWEQAALAQCSVFEGGFTLDAAEAVLDLSAWPQGPPVLDVVQALFDKSLLRSWTPAGERRYDVEEMYFAMYLSIREYAAARLRADGVAAEAAERRHGRHFASFGDDDAIEALSRHGGTRLRRRLAVELDNLVSACRRAVRRGDGATAVAAYHATWAVLQLAGSAALGATLGAEILGMEGLDPPTLATARDLYGNALRRAGRAEEAGAALEAALAHFRAAGDAKHVSGALVSLGNLRRDQGRLEDARASLEAAHAITRVTGDRPLEGYLLGNLGILHAEQGRLEDARAHFAQAIAIHREVGNRRIEGIDTCNLGIACFETGLFAEARTHLDAALAIHREDGNRRDEGVTLANLGALSVVEGHSREALPIYEAAVQILRDAGDRVQEAYVDVALANVLRDDGRVAEGLAYCERALEIARAIGNRRIQGACLATQSELLAANGAFAQSRAALADGEASLRAAGDPLGIANLLCSRGRVELAAGDTRAARDALTGAERALADTSAGGDSAVAREIAELHERLARAP